MGFCKMDTLHLPSDVNTMPFLCGRHRASHTEASLILSVRLNWISCQTGFTPEGNEIQEILCSALTRHLGKPNLSSSSAFSHIIFSYLSDLLFIYLLLIVSLVCLVFYLVPMSKTSFSSKYFQHSYTVGWIACLFRSCLLSDTELLCPGSLHCYYWHLSLMLTLSLIFQLCYFQNIPAHVIHVSFISNLCFHGHIELLQQGKNFCLLMANFAF